MVAIFIRYVDVINLGKTTNTLDDQKLTTIEYWLSSILEDKLLLWKKH